MSNDHVMPPGARHATHFDALKVFRAVDDLTRDFKYAVGLCGSTLTKAHGKDIDLVIASAEDCVTPSHVVANALVQKFSKRLLQYEELDSDAQTISLTYLQRNAVVVDVLIVGLPE
jgi:hypothetical protein